MAVVIGPADVRVWISRRFGGMCEAWVRPPFCHFHCTAGVKKETDCPEGGRLRYHCRSMVKADPESRSRPRAAGSRSRKRNRTVTRSQSPAQQDHRDPRRLLARIVETPHLARAVPRLPAEVLHRIIESCSLEDCAELVALTTTDQLSVLWDLDLWRSARPGQEETLDAARFGVWLEVLAESGADVAARRLAEIDVDVVIAAFAQYLRVFDPAVLSPLAEAGGDDAVINAPPTDGLYHEIGGYRVVAKRTGSWDTIVAVLVALDAEHHDCFNRVMRGCRNLSNSKPEVDGLDDLLAGAEQLAFDVTLDREQRREKQG